MTQSTTSPVGLHGLPSPSAAIPQAGRDVLPRLALSGLDGLRLSWGAESTSQTVIWPDMTLKAEDGLIIMLSVSTQHAAL